MCQGCSCVLGVIVDNKTLLLNVSTDGFYIRATYVCTGDIIMSTFSFKLIKLNVNAFLTMLIILLHNVFIKWLIKYQVVMSWFMCP